MEKIARAFCILLVFILLFVSFFHEITAITQDLGRHLLFGDIILQTKSVPSTNFLSYTHPNFPFINHHWLSEVILTIVFGRFGFAGLLVVTTTVALCAFLLVFWTSLRKNNVLALCVASFLYLGILLERTDVRPEVFSFLFLSSFIVILYKNRTRSTRWIFLLPLLQLLWVNMHIFFIVGTATIGLFLIDGIVMHRKRVVCKQTSILVAVLTVSVLATLINPNGIKGALYPFFALQNYGYSIEENQHIWFLWNYAHKQTILYFVASVALLFASLLLTIKKTRLIDWFLAIFFTIVASLFIRNFGLFIFGTFPAFAYACTLLSQKVTLRQTLYTLSLLLLIGVFLYRISAVASAKRFGAHLPKGEDFVLFFLKHNLQGPLFNNFDIGSYLAYRLYPKERVFVDGRPETYPASFFKETYISMQESAKKFKEVENLYGFNVTMFSHTDQTPWAASFMRFILNDERWKLVYLDDTVFILVRNTDKNRKIIEKFSMNKESVQINNFNKLNKLSLIRLILFFRRAGWENQELAMYERLLALEPNSCTALRGLSLLSTRELSAIYRSRFDVLCR